MKINIYAYGYKKEEVFYNMLIGSGVADTDNENESLQYIKLRAEGLKRYNLTYMQEFVRFGESFVSKIFTEQPPIRFDFIDEQGKKLFSIYSKKENNMAKNNKPDFKSGTKNVFDNIVNPEVPTVENAPQATTEEPKKNPVGRPRSVGYTRTSVILNDEQMSKVRCISGRDNVNQKDIIEYALQMFIDKYESVHGTVEVEVTSGKRDVNSLFDL